jgi:hypothetical protein
MPDTTTRAHTRLIDGTLMYCIPVEDIASANREAARRRNPTAERVRHDKLIICVVTALADIDPDRAGLCPRDILQALDRMGQSWWADRPWDVRLRRFTTHLCSEVDKPRSRLERDAQHQYRASTSRVVPFTSCAKMGA